MRTMILSLMLFCIINTAWAQPTAPTTMTTDTPTTTAAPAPAITTPAPAPAKTDLTTAAANTPTTEGAPLFPASIESMTKMWNIVTEICMAAKIEPYDCYVEQVADDGMILKIEAPKYIKFVRSAMGPLGNPLLRLNRLGDNQQTSATFNYKLWWPANGTKTAFDQQILSLDVLGQKPEQRTMQIIVLCIGKPDPKELFDLFSETSAP